MSNHHVIAILLALPLVGATACDQDDPAEQEQELAEEQAEARAEEQGYGPVDQQIRGEVAEKRSELEDEVGAAESDVENPGLTGAQRLDAVEDGEMEETGY